MSNLGTFDPEVQQRIEEVSGKFNDFISRQKTEIIKAKEEYTGKVRQLQNEHKELLKSLGDLERREKELNKVIERDIIDSNSSESRLNDLRVRERQLQEERRSLEAQVAHLKQRVDNRRNEYSILKLNQQKQAEINLPETLIYEQLLGFKIEGIKDDLLKLVFRNIDSQDPDREYSLVLDVSQHTYKIDNVTPSISEDALQNALQEFNKSRDLTQFLKKMRSLFKDLP